MFIESIERRDSEYSSSVFLVAYFNTSLYQDELFERLDVAFPAAIQRSVSRRKAEFLAGRVLARRGLFCLGSQTGEVGVAADRSPIWPSGFKGSITHSDDNIAVIIASGVDHIVGVDIENMITNASANAVQENALTEKERYLLNRCPKNRLYILSIVFSAKESLFKAVYPRCQCFFDFIDAEMNDLPTENVIHLKLLSSLPGGFLKGSCFTINWKLINNKIITWIDTPFDGYLK